MLHCKFSGDYNSERIFKIGQYLTKLCRAFGVHFFRPTLCVVTQMVMMCRTGWQLSSWWVTLMKWLMSISAVLAPVPAAVCLAWSLLHHQASRLNSDWSSSIEAGTQQYLCSQLAGDLHCCATLHSVQPVLALLAGKAFGGVYQCSKHLCVLSDLLLMVLRGICFFVRPKKISCFRKSAWPTLFIARP